MIDVLILPLVLFVLGIWLPRLFERQRRITFINLIRREIKEMSPYPSLQAMQTRPMTRSMDRKLESIHARWPEHLGKRFVHENILKNVSENRDFILSLPPDLIYYLSQLWIEYEKAKEKSERLEKPGDHDPKIAEGEWPNDAELIAHVIQWHHYLLLTCCFLDRYGKVQSFSDEGNKSTLYADVFMKWHDLLKFYYPHENELNQTECIDKDSEYLKPSA